jgi:hypothetical protein
MLTPYRWLDTQPEGQPTGSTYASAVWLLGRHDQLAALAARIPDLVHQDVDGSQWIDLDHLAKVISRCDATRATGRGIDDEDGLAIPVRHFGVMSGTEQTRLRLLAVFATTRVPLRSLDLSSLDEAGQRLLADWFQALHAC